MPTRTTVWPSGSLCWVDCQVDDVPAAAHFYTELLGWQIAPGPPEIPGSVLATLGGHRAAGIGTKVPGQPSVWSTYFATDDLTSAVARSVAAGGSVMTPPQQVGPLGWMSFGTDRTGAPFGLWQAHEHTGLGVFNEPGTVCWTELHTDDHDGARAYYEQLFGWSYTEPDSPTPLPYSYVHVPGVAEPVGGISTDRGGHSHWLPWFAVRSVASVAADARLLGGAVVTAPVRSWFGEMAVLQAPQGERFGVIDTSEAATRR